MPYARALDTLGTDIVLDSGDYAGLLDKALAAVEWPRLRARRWRRAARPANWSAPASRCSWRKAGWVRSIGSKSTSIRDGTVEVITGSASVGQGMETVIAQICADALGVDYRERPRHPRPDRPHRARHGRVRLARHGDDRRSDADAAAARSGRRRSRRRRSCCKRRLTCSTWWTAKSFAPTRPRALRSARRDRARPAADSPLRHGRAPGLRRRAGSIATT